MAPLGLQMTTIGSLGGPQLAMGGGAVIFPDKFWVGCKDFYDGPAKGQLRNLECEIWPIPALNDFNDMWDLDANDDYMPALTPVAEGWWEVDGSNITTTLLAGACC